MDVSRLYKFDTKLCLPVPYITRFSFSMYHPFALSHPLCNSDILSALLASLVINDTNKSCSFDPLKVISPFLSNTWQMIRPCSLQIFPLAPVADSLVFILSGSFPFFQYWASSAIVPPLCLFLCISHFIILTSLSANNVKNIFPPFSLASDFSLHSHHALKIAFLILTNAIFPPMLLPPHSFDPSLSSLMPNI